MNITILNRDLQYLDHVACEKMCAIFMDTMYIEMYFKIK